MKTKLLLLFALFCAITANAFDGTLSITGPATGPSGDWGIDVDMTTTDGNIFTLSNHTFVAGEMKFRENHAWAVAYGVASGSGSGYPTGTGLATGSVSNIVVPAGTYNVTFNYTTKAYTFTAGVPQFPVISLFGNATGDADIIMATTDGANYQAKSVTTSVGSLRFRRDMSSATSWGSSSFPSGEATQAAGDIAIPGGTYNINFNLASGDFSFTYTAVGMIGVGGPSASWDNDATMNTTDGIIYTLNNVIIAGGGMKIRDNGAWAVQFGTAGQPADTPFPNGTAVQNGNDMITQTGVYNITFNRTTKEYSFATLSVENFAKMAVKVYPNPSQNEWNFVSANETITSVQIVDVLGKTIAVKNVNDTQVKVDATQLPQGLYFAKIYSAKGTQTLKVVKK